MIPVLQTWIQSITETGVVVFVLLWANNKVELRRKIIIILQVPVSPFLTRGDGDPKLHITFWIGDTGKGLRGQRFV